MAKVVDQAGHQASSHDRTPQPWQCLQSAALRTLLNMFDGSCDLQLSLYLLQMVLQATSQEDSQRSVIREAPRMPCTRRAPLPKRIMQPPAHLPPAAGGH